jgi:hypothetical protein
LEKQPKHQTMKLIHLSLILGISTAMVLTSCKKDEDPCDNIVCSNGGTCNDGSCSCATGYEGSTCGSEVRAKFIGLYNGTIACTGVSQAGNITITNSAAGITSIVIDDGADTFTGTVSGSSINIATQTISGGVTVSGTGQISGLVLTLNLNLGGNTCTYTGTKQ